MTVIENAERPFEKGKCPMCGEPIVYYEDYEYPYYKPWKCTGCGGYGRENKTSIGPIHTDLQTVHGVSVVLMEDEDYANPTVQVDLHDEKVLQKPEYPRTVSIRSDYSSDTSMRITMTEDGDVIFKIRGPGEMRIATNGGAFHGQQLAKFCEAAKAIMELAESDNK